MKRLLLVTIFALSTFIMISCDTATTVPNDTATTASNDTATTESNDTNVVTTDTGSQNNADVEALMTQLIAAGYELDERDADSVAYYNENAVNLRYNISVTVTEVYLGYVNQVERWAELVGFVSEADAIAYTNGIAAVDTSGMLYFRHGSAVVITYSQDTIDALS